MVGCAVIGKETVLADIQEFVWKIQNYLNPQDVPCPVGIRN
jgi:hypothetical protein